MKRKITILFLPLFLVSFNQTRIDNCHPLDEIMAKGLQCSDSISYFTSRIDIPILSDYDTIEVDYRILMESSYYKTGNIDSIYVKRLECSVFDSNFWDEIIVYGWNREKRKYDLICIWGLDFGETIMSNSECKNMINHLRYVIMDDLETHLYYYDREDWEENKDIYRHSQKHVFMGGVLWIYDSIAKNYFVTGL